MLQKELHQVRPSVERIRQLLLFWPRRQLFYRDPIVRSIPLHSAVEWCHPNIVEELLKYDPEEQVLQRDNTGNLPLQRAVEGGMIDNLRLLLRHEPLRQVVNRTEYGITLHHAISRGSAEMANLLLSHNAQAQLESRGDMDAIHIAAQRKGAEMINVLLPYGREQALQSDRLRNLPLHYACMRDSLAGAEALLEVHPKRQVVQKNFAGKIPLSTIPCTRGIPSFQLGALLLQHDPVAQLEACHSKSGVDNICNAQRLSFPRIVEASEEWFQVFVNLLQEGLLFEEHLDMVAEGETKRRLMNAMCRRIPKSARSVVPLDSDS